MFKPLPESFVSTIANNSIDFSEVADIKNNKEVFSKASNVVASRNLEDKGTLPTCGLYDGLGRCLKSAPVKNETNAGAVIKDPFATAPKDVKPPVKGLGTDAEKKTDKVDKKSVWSSPPREPNTDEKTHERTHKGDLRDKEDVKKERKEDADKAVRHHKSMKRTSWFDDRREAMKTQKDDVQKGERKIRRGDTLWDLARTALELNGKKPNAKEVMQEVLRIAKLNKITDYNKIKIGTAIKFK